MAYPALKRTSATRGHYNPSGNVSPRRGRRGSVTFDEITSIYPLEGDSTDPQQQVGILRSDPEEETLDQGRHTRCYTCNTLVEKKSIRIFFRFCAVVNLLSLGLSAPLRVCSLDNDEENKCLDVFYQFVIIAGVDLVLSILYGVQVYLWTQYLIFLYCRGHKRKVVHEVPDLFESDHNQSVESGYRSDIVRLLTLVLVFFCLLYSVGIGVYRSYKVYDHLTGGMGSPVINPFLYYPLIFRSITAVSSLKLFVHLKIPTSALNSLYKNVKNRWKQLLFVTIFYFFFIYMFALIGVQWFGGLNERCYYTPDDSTPVLSIPTTHCSNVSGSSIIQRCFGNPDMTCMADNESRPLNFNYRNTVYLGQFRLLIVDALFAVYEASSWELWSYMQYNALAGSSRFYIFVLVLYVAMIFFLVIFQNIFLVVIIESFADLRSEEAGELSSKQKDKPTIVLYEQKGSTTNEIGFKYIKTQESLSAFKKRLDTYYYKTTEKFFTVLVLVDAIITSTKHTEMPDILGQVLRFWQLGVSILFVLEVVGLFFFHLLANPMQLVLFFKTRYFWYLMIIAIGGLVAAIPIDGHIHINDPWRAGNVLALFQMLRLPRALNLSSHMRKFFLSIIGDGIRLLIVILIVLVFLIWFAIISMLVFGYLKAEPECKERVGSDLFRDFFHSFLSMFQLLMQEGWSQLFSETMCRRNDAFFIINFYFFLLHLFFSLILLNFFVAAILDNLDYDEDVKRKKLEEAEKNTAKIQKIPYHLRIFQLCGPKKIPIPKLSSTDVPNLTEVDVQNFYNIGEVNDYSTGFLPEQSSILSSDVNVQRRSSKLSELNLLTEEDSISVGNGISADQGKYWGIQGLLSHVKAFRQHSREKEENRPSQTIRGTSRGDVLSNKGQADPSSLLMQSEYDEFREKYHLFDTALFCMPPGHKLRKFCKAVLTKQMKEPTTNPLREREQQNIFKHAIEIVFYLFRYCVSPFPYFTWFMILVTLTSLVGQIRETFNDEMKKETTYLLFMDIIFVCFTFLELILKILANGLFFNPHAAIQTLWDIVDWLIVLGTLGVVVVYGIACPKVLELNVTFRLLPPWMIFLLSLRALRPLRLISLIPRMRHVMYELLLGWRKFLQAIVLLVFFIFMFASYGVQLFAGKESPEGFCNDPTQSQNDCVGEFLINIEPSPQESLPLVVGNGTDIFILVPRVWYSYHRNFRFDNTWEAFITLFEVLTLEGWLDVRDLFGTGGDLVNLSKYSWFMFIYIHLFVFFGVNFGLQLFVGIVVNNFNEHKPDHSALLTVSQKRWTDLLQRISLTRPIKKPPPPRDNKFRLFLYKIFVSQTYRHVNTLIVILNSGLLWVPWVNINDQKEELEISTLILMSLSVAFTFFFIIEVLLKLVAFGPRKYFQSWRNFFDFFVFLLGDSYVILAIVYLSNPADVRPVADLFLTFNILKLFTILMKYSTLQKILSTVGSTIIKSGGLLGVLFSIILLFSLLGNLYFSNLRSGEAINFSFVNFARIQFSANLVIRVVTGEDWHTIFRDAMVDQPYCSPEEGTCGSVALAIFFFIVYYVFVSFMLLNVIIAVLLENFSIFYNEDDTAVNHAVVRDFKLNWLFYDKDASGSISSNKIKLFLRMLKLKDFYTYVSYENGVKERQQKSLLMDPNLLREMAEELRWDQKQQAVRSEVTTSATGGNPQAQEDKEHNIPFQDVLKMLAYRAEDISQRLVPHQLYVREELEHSVQFDVAEQCILKWVQKFVKPVVHKQERVRRNTVVNPYRGPKKQESSIVWPSLIDSGDEGIDGNESTPVESEDEQSTLPHSKSEEESAYLDVDMDRLQNPLLAKSYTRLEGASYFQFKQKGHEWFEMQKNWMTNVEEDPENYFDDNL